MDKIYELAVNPMIFPFYCLERVSSLQHKERKPKQNLTNSIITEMLLIVQGSQHSQDRVLERRELYREKTPEICKELSIQLSTDQFICVRKLLLATEKTHKRIRGNSTWMVPDPTSETGKT